MQNGWYMANGGLTMKHNKEPIIDRILDWMSEHQPPLWISLALALMSILVSTATIALNCAMYS